MALEKLSLILFAFTFCSNFVVGTKRVPLNLFSKNWNQYRKKQKLPVPGVYAGYNDCTPPWLADSNPFLATIKSNVLYRCPSIFGDPKKEYCCYDSNGDVECCDYKQYIGFRLICLIPFFIIGLLILSIIICISCFLCSSCYIHKRRRTGYP